jgi:hypothetical protein
MGINVRTRHIAIFSGSNIRVRQDHYQQAIDTFASKMHETHDNYTQSVLAALTALESSSDRFWSGVSHALPFVFIGLILVVSIVFSILFRGSGYNSYNRYRNGGWGGGGGGGGSSGGGSSSSGGGGGASGNF